MLDLCLIMAHINHVEQNKQQRKNKMTQYLEQVVDLICQGMTLEQAEHHINKEVA